MRNALSLALLAVAVDSLQFGSAPCLVAHQRIVVLERAFIVLQEQAPEPAAQPEAAAQPAAPVEESSYLAKEKARFGVSDDAVNEDGTRVAVPSFFAKREEEKPGAALGKEGLNEQGYDPYDAKAIDSSTVDTKPVFVALAVATLASVALSASHMIV